MQENIPLYQMAAGNETSFFDFLAWQQEENEYDASLPHRHAYYEVIFLEQGEGVHEIDFAPQMAKAPALHFLPIGKAHKLSLNPPYNGASLLFSAAFFPPENQWFSLAKLPFFQHNNPYPILLLNESQAQYFKALFSEIKAAWQGNPTDKWAWIRVHLSLLLLQSQRLYQLDNTQRPFFNSEVIQKFIQLIEIHHLEHWTLNQYADQLFISEPHLNTLCKKECGMSASQLLHERVIQSAKRQLAYTQDTIKEIAFSLNFSDVSYFIRFFKKKVGYSPQAYREQLQKEM
ncbi:MAG: helix-turn-helix domain-containing protein [Bacteroidia bacterium]